MGARIFVDESKSAGYLLVAAMVQHEDLPHVRRTLQALLLPNQRRLHFTKENPSRRRRIAKTIAALPVEALVVSAPGRNTEAAARAACLARLAQEAGSRSVEMIVLEQDDSLLELDRRTLYEALAGTDVGYDHQRPHQEAALWIPDAIAWCWTKGGSWRRLVAPLVTQSFEV